jgi:hypothetical protein
MNAALNYKESFQEPISSIKIVEDDYGNIKIEDNFSLSNLTDTDVVRIRKPRTGISPEALDIKKSHGTFVFAGPQL